MSATELLLPAERLPRWVENFIASHGRTAFEVSEGRLAGDAADGSSFSVALPFSMTFDGAADVESLVAAATVPDDWGVLLVRKGGFAVARLRGTAMTGHKIGQRHVQGRTKAGGQSQQRFARRRDNQARMAYEAAAGHAVRLLSGLGRVVVGGDRGGVEQVLADARLRGIDPVGPWLDVPDPRRAELDQAVRSACALPLRVTNA